MPKEEKDFFPGSVSLVYGKQYLTEKYGDLQFQISPASFLQPNHSQSLQLYNCIKEFAELTSNDFAYDLYTGAGTIASYLAKDAKNILGMEGSLDAIKDAQVNQQKNQLTNVSFIQSDILQGFTKDFVDANDKPSVIILDPPRAGTLVEIKKAMIHASPKRIVYVSCNPVSLAWDLKQLCEFYKVIAIQPFDMFPHTHHIETVVLLEKK